MSKEVIERVVERDRRQFHATIKKSGQEPGMQDDEKNAPNIIKFMSYHKNLNLFRDSFNIIQFKSHVFRTDNQKDILFLRKHAALNDTFWEGELPKEVVDKFKKDKTMVVRSEDVFAVPEAGY